MTVDEISPELFQWELYSANLLWLLDDALHCAEETLDAAFDVIKYTTKRIKQLKEMT